MAERSDGRSPGALLTRTRLELGLKQAAMARRMGITQQTLSRLERDEYAPSLAIMERAAAAAGKTFAFLFMPKGWAVWTTQPELGEPWPDDDTLAEWEKALLEDIVKEGVPAHDPDTCPATCCYDGDHDD